MSNTTKLSLTRGQNIFNLGSKKEQLCIWVLSIDVVRECQLVVSSKRVCLHFHRAIHLTEEGDGFVKEDRAPYTWKH